jgi:hypothetical protein
MCCNNINGHRIWLGRRPLYSNKLTGSGLYFPGCCDLLFVDIRNKIFKQFADPTIKAYHGKMKASKETLKKSLEGRITKHHQFMLQLIKQSITDKENLITTLDAQIAAASKAYMVVIELLQTIRGCW